MKRNRKIILLIILILSVFTWLPGHSLYAAETKTETADPTVEITMLDVHQGLSILISSDEKYMLYDGGGRERSSYVVAYLKSHGITELEYMFASHYDEDHIAGLVGVLNTTTVDTFVRPDYEADTKIYQSLVNMADKNGCKTVYPSVGDEYTLGDATITVLAPETYGSSDNNNSVAIRVEFSDVSCIITGDAEEEEELEMVSSGEELDSDLYVAGHHGSASSSCTRFLNAVTPAYTFISCGEDNSYGHPAEAALERLKESGTQIFRTDLQGEITISYNGETGELTFSEDPCNDWAPGYIEEENEPVASEQKSVVAEETPTSDASADGSQTYILNTNTKKFHYPDCRSVQQMKDKNKKEITATRDEIIGMGYDPCGNCQP